MHSLAREKSIPYYYYCYFKATVQSPSRVADGLTLRVCVCVLVSFAFLSCIFFFFNSFSLVWFVCVCVCVCVFWGKFD